MNARIAIEHNHEMSAKVTAPDLNAWPVLGHENQFLDGGVVSGCRHGSIDQANVCFSDFPPESCLSGVHPIAVAS